MTAASSMGIHHVGFTVRDVEQEAAFYSQVFQRPPFVRRVYDDAYTGEQLGYPGAALDVALFEIPGGTTVLELIQYLDPEGDPVDLETKNPGTAHLCLWIHDIEAESARLVSLGATPRSTGPVSITSGPSVGRRVQYLRDPAGITIELLEVEAPL